MSGSSRSENTGPVSKVLYASSILALPSLLTFSGHFQVEIPHSKDMASHRVWHSIHIIRKFNLTVHLNIISSLVEARRPCSPEKFPVIAPDSLLPARRDDDDGKFSATWGKIQRSGGRGGEIRRKGRGNSEAGGLGREGEGTWGKNKDKSLW